MTPYKNNIRNFIVEGNVCKLKWKTTVHFLQRQIIFFFLYLQYRGSFDLFHDHTLSAIATELTKKTYNKKNITLQFHIVVTHIANRVMHTQIWTCERCSPPPPPTHTRHLWTPFQSHGLNLALQKPQPPLCPSTPSRGPHPLLHHPKIRPKTLSLAWQTLYLPGR